MLAVWCRCCYCWLLLLLLLPLKLPVCVNFFLRFFSLNRFEYSTSVYMLIVWLYYIYYENPSAVLTFGVILTVIDSLFDQDCTRLRRLWRWVFTFALILSLFNLRDYQIVDGFFASLPFFPLKNPLFNGDFFVVELKKYLYIPRVECTIRSLNTLKLTRLQIKIDRSSWG